MCNNIHAAHWKIPEEGVGWKLFSFNKEITSLVMSNRYEKDEKGFITWKTKSGGYPTKGHGFCFFLDKREAIEALKDWVAIKTVSDFKSIIRKIKYKKGLCLQKEDMFTNHTYEIALCKSFKIGE